MLKCQRWHTIADRWPRPEVTHNHRQLTWANLLCGWCTIWYICTQWTPTILLYKLWKYLYPCVLHLQITWKVQVCQPTCVAVGTRAATAPKPPQPPAVQGCEWLWVWFEPMTWHEVGEGEPGYSHTGLTLQHRRPVRSDHFQTFVLYHIVHFILTHVQTKYAA